MTPCQQRGRGRDESCQEDWKGTTLAKRGPRCLGPIPLMTAGLATCDDGCHPKAEACPSGEAHGTRTPPFATPGFPRFTFSLSQSSTSSRLPLRAATTLLSLLRLFWPSPRLILTWILLKQGLQPRLHPLLSTPARWPARPSATASAASMSPLCSSSTSRTAPSAAPARPTTAPPRLRLRILRDEDPGYRGEHTLVRSRRRSDDLAWALCNMFCPANCAGRGTCFFDSWDDDAAEERPS